jgi:nicotinate-nucleotide adenylyltransferase
MLELAVGGHRAFEVSTIEIDRGGVSYTVQTLQAVAQSWPEAAFFLLMGSDSLADLPSWREPSRICELSTPVVVHRAGEAAADFHGLAELLPADRIAEIAAMQVQMPRIDLSSTDLRTRVAAGRSIRFRTPRAVEMYIQTTGLYRKLPADAVGGPGAG